MLSHISKAKRLLYGVWNEEWWMPFTCQFWLISWEKSGGVSMHLAASVFFVYFMINKCY